MKYIKIVIESEKDNIYIYYNGVHKKAKSKDFLMKYINEIVGDFYEKL